MQAVHVTAEETRPLRHRVLRPHQSEEQSIYPLDHQEGVGHYGVFADGALRAVGSIFEEGREGREEPPAWRIRGMATEEDYRGRGFGGLVLEALVRHAADRGGKLVWCNGRTTVEGFYGRFGFAAEGDVFDLPGLGPHLVMVRLL